MDNRKQVEWTVVMHNGNGVAVMATSRDNAMIAAENKTKLFAVDAWRQS